MLKVKIVISLVFCILSGFIHAQEIKYEEAAYNLINEVYDSKGQHAFLSKKVIDVDWEEYLDIEWINKNNSGIDKFFEPIDIELSEEDLKFMRKQAFDNKLKRWKKRHVKSFHLIGEGKRIDYSKFSKYKLSKPIFNEDMSFSIVFEEYIGGMENASFHLRIFKIENNAWKEIAFVQIWIS